MSRRKWRSDADHEIDAHPVGPGFIEVGFERIRVSTGGRMRGGAANIVPRQQLDGQSATGGFVHSDQRP